MYWPDFAAAKTNKVMVVFPFGHQFKTPRLISELQFPNESFLCKSSQ